MTTKDTKTLASHTPGPWALGRPGPNVARNWWPVEALHEGCQTFGSPIAWALDGRKPEETAEANARLIAAAPEMLIALQDLCEADRDDLNDGTSSVWQAAVDAIAKATGG